MITETRIPAGSYFLFCATISVLCSRLVFKAFDETDIANVVSPLVLSLFKHFVAVSTCCSSVYPFLLSPPMVLDFKWYKVALTALCVVAYYSAGQYSSRAALSIFIVYTLFRSLAPIFKLALFSYELKDNMELMFHLAIGSTTLLVGCKNDRLITCVAPFIILCVIVSWLVAKWYYKLSALAAKIKELLWKQWWWQFMSYVIAVLGSVLFQNFFKLKSKHVVAFLHFEGAWLANLALVFASKDGGIFYFMIANVILNFSVNGHGLQWNTWLMYGVSLILIGVSLLLRSVRFVESIPIRVQGVRQPFLVGLDIPPSLEYRVEDFKRGIQFLINKILRRSTSHGSDSNLTNSPPSVFIDMPDTDL